MASSSSGIVSDDDSDETRTFLRSSPETTSRASYAARLAAEASQMNTQAVELDVRKVFDYLRPSRVEKFREAMDGSMLKLTISAEKAQSRLGEGHDILANRKWAKECQSTASLVRDIVNCKRIRKATSEELTWEGFDFEKLRKHQELLSKAADGFDADIKELQERIGRL